MFQRFTIQIKAYNIAANDYVQLLEENEIAISMAGVGKAYENGYAERLMRTIKERRS